jgi:hypothetical protein
MRTCAWLAAGGILLFAVSGHPAFLNLRVTGLILLARGAAGCWLAFGPDGGTHLVRRLRAAAIEFEARTAELAGQRGSRVPLDDLLSSEVKENC